jgi:hypothetical protein
MTCSTSAVAICRSSASDLVEEAHVLDGDTAWSANVATRAISAEVNGRASMRSRRSAAALAQQRR